MGSSTDGPSSIMCRETAFADGRHRCGLRPDHTEDHECIGNCGTTWFRSEVGGRVMSSPNDDTRKTVAACIAAVYRNGGVIIGADWDAADAAIAAMHRDPEPWVIEALALLFDPIWSGVEPVENSNAHEKRMWALREAVPSDVRQKAGIADVS